MLSRPAILAVILLATCLPLCAQIPAPGAFDNATRCSQSTCIWVPYITSKTFQRGPYSYYVKAADSGGTFYLQRDHKTILKTNLRDLSASVSVSWAPGNTGFSVTWSEGGAIGNFHVKVFLIRNGKVLQVPATTRAFSGFKSSHYCKARGDNVQAYSWVNATDLLIIASVYPTSDCGPQMGYTQGYIVRAKTGAILRHMNSQHLAAYMKHHPQ